MSLFVFLFVSFANFKNFLKTCCINLRHIFGIFTTINFILYHNTNIDIWRYYASFLDFHNFKHSKCLIIEKGAKLVTLPNLGNWHVGSNSWIFKFLGPTNWVISIGNSSSNPSLNKIWLFHNFKPLPPINEKIWTSLMIYNRAVP